MGDELDRLRRILEGIQQDLCYKPTGYHSYLIANNLTAIHEPFMWSGDNAKN